MPYVISHFFPSGTAAQYEAAMKAMNGELGRIPDGQIAHVAGPVPGGFRVIAIQGSKENWDRFMNEVFATVMGRGVEGSFIAPPTELKFEATHFYR
ncbi:hypothetical protein GQ651_02900 [Alphaproteobacteria bacterium GH1-50]|uniref:Antibiotic biosynthesis monooxygenase n=1 Tax=Kangsaoukella pontilimi TaxID=2691042 RepID=A0A7C9IEP7_9RHOB|nr:hypothetical protein [Kangsaoukella pontilimi]MXQ06787.1 hypothetical protein [Kangsaoukella pontilimi]